MNIKEYGVKKTCDGYWETFANVQDGKYLTPITWLREQFKNKSNAIKWLKVELKLLGVDYDKK